MEAVAFDLGVVACWRYVDGSSSGAAYVRLKDAATCEAEASVFRFTVPGREGFYLAWVTLDPSIFDEVDYGPGKPVRLDDESAAQLIARWVAIREIDAHNYPDGTPVRREAHYENGRPLDTLGGVLPPEDA